MKLSFFFILLILSFSFISASLEGEVFNGGDGQYLISQTPGDIQNSPFRYEEENNMKAFGITLTGKEISKITPISLCWIIPLIVVLILIILCICKKEKIKKWIILKRRRKGKDED